MPFSKDPDFFKHLLENLNLNSETVPDLQQWKLFIATLETYSAKFNLVQIELEKSRAHMISSSKLSSVGEMAGGIAHEINTPLSVIQMRTEQLLEQAREDKNVDKPFTLKALQSIDVTVRRVATIVRNLRSFARVSPQGEIRHTSIKQIVDQTFSLCHEKFVHHGIYLSYNADSDFDIEAHDYEISQVLFNLLMNSYDAISTLPEKWIKVEVTKHNNCCRLSVTDSGKGISEDIQDKIMNPFFTTKVVGQGTGLGLSISKSIIETHAGQLFLDNKCPNTRFVIEFPLSAAQTLVG